MNVCGIVGRDLPWRTFIDYTGNGLKKCRIKSTKNRRTCMERLVYVDEAKEVCQIRSKCRSPLRNRHYVYAVIYIN